MKCSQLEYLFIHLTNVQCVPTMCQAVFLTPSSGVFALPSYPSSLGISNTAVLMGNVKDLFIVRRTQTQGGQTFAHIRSSGPDHQPSVSI